MKCQCEFAGYCETHQRNMSELRYHQCKNETGYFAAFQRGSRTPVFAESQIGIGTRLKEIIKRENPGIVTCGDCSTMAAELNQMSREEVLADIDRFVSEIAKRVAEKAPKLWQRIAVKVDQALHIGETERRIKQWVLEAIDSEKPQLADKERPKQPVEPMGN